MLAAALLPLLWAAAQADEGEGGDVLDDDVDALGEHVDEHVDDVENVQLDDAVAFSNWGDK